MARGAGPSAGSGGKGRRKLAGRGPTPPAEERTGHPKARRAASVARRAATTQPPRAASSRAQSPRDQSPRDQSPRDRRDAAGPRVRTGMPQVGDDELVVGRNPVVEALRAKVPASALLVAAGIDDDERVTEVVALARKRNLDILEMTRIDLDRATGRAPHQGLALRVPPYTYLHPDDLLDRALSAPGTPLLVALDGVTDPHNLGSAIRSTAAFGGQGVLIPERRAAGVTASAWKASAGAAARIPVARARNLTRTLTSYQQAGLMVAGLAADGAMWLDDLELAVDGLVLVVGSEGKGLSRLVAETCDVLLSIPMAGAVESLNAGVAAAVALAEVARVRRVKSAGILKES